MDLKYQKIKKLDLKKWLLGGNSKIYFIILVVFLAAVIFVLSSIKDMGKSAETAETSPDLPTEQTKEEQTSFIQDNLSYKIRINKAQNYLTVYKLDSDNVYQPYSTFACSVNSSVQTGETVISSKQTWLKLSGSAYGHYSCILGNGEYIHSVPYWSQDIKRLNFSAYNLLGSTAQVGSVYLQVKDAKWIYENCGVNIAVEIYEDESEKAPMSYVIPDKLSSQAYYDPSDTEASSGNISGKINYMSGVKNCTTPINQPFDKWAGIYAVDTDGNDITSWITISGEVDVTKAGTYTLIYYLSDNYGTNLAYYRYVTVTESQ